MKWKRTAMSLALAGCMMATTVPVTAFAANETTVASEKAAGVVKLDSFGIKMNENEKLAVGNTVGASLTYTASGSDSVDLSNVTWTLAGNTGSAHFVTGADAQNNLKATGAVVSIIGDTAGKVVLTATYGSEADENLKTDTVVLNVEDKTYTTQVSIPAAVSVVPSKASDKITLTKDGNADSETITWEELLDEDNIIDPSTDIEAQDDGTYKVTTSGEGTAVVRAKVAGTDADGKDYVKYSNQMTITSIYGVGNGVIKTDQNATLTTTKVGTSTTLKVDLTNTENNPYTGSSTVEWSVNNANASITSDGVFTAKTAGDVKVQATVKVDGKVVGVYTQVVKITEETKALTSVALSESTLTLAVGDTKALTVTTNEGASLQEDADGNTDNAIVWTSSDENVLKSGKTAGTFKAVAKGSAVVTVEVKGYDAQGQKTSKKAVCTVEVVEAAASSVKAFSINSIADLKINNSVALNKDSVTVSDPTSTNIKLEDSDITWTSKNPEIAKIQNGYLVGVSEGTAQIQATINGITELTTVKVVKPTTTDELKAVQFAINADIMMIGSTKTNAAIITPANVYTPVYTSSNEKVATVDENGKVKALAAGTTTITATVGTKSASYGLTVVDPNASVDPQPTGFVDVPANAWYADAVNTAAAKGLMNGTGNNKFEPLKTVQRSQVAAIVWNIEGAPAVTGTTPFTDVAADAWYAQAVTWAYQNKVVSGTSATTFAPNQNITRQDFAVVLYNKAGKPAASADLSKFVDASKINSWAQDAVKWAVSKGIINGNDKNELNPTGTLTRAEAASIIVKYVG